MESYQVKMAREIDLRGLGDFSRRRYLDSIKVFVDYFGKDPEKISLEEIKDFLLHYQNQTAAGKETKRAPNTVNQMKSIISFYYSRVLGLDYYEKLPNMKLPKRMPVILTQEEVQKMIDPLENYFWKAVVMTLYSTGIRMNELRNLRVSDVDSKRMVIRINQGKGRKDREVILTQELLAALRDYWSKHRRFLKVKSEYLFIPTKNTYDGVLKKRLSHTAVGYIVKKAAEIGGIKKKLPLMF